MNVSAFMTVKNGERFVEGSILSIARQSEPVDELVIVDDGSADNTIEIINRLKESIDLKINLIVTGGVGRAKALNIALDATSGTWVANLDVDDCWHPEKNKIQLQAALREQRADVIISDSLLVYGEEGGFSFDYPCASDGRYLRDKDFYIRNPVNHSSVLMNKAALGSLLRYNEGLNKQIDVDLWGRLVSEGVRFYFVSCKLAVKRLHKSQSFESKGRLRYSFGAMRLGYKNLIKLRAAWYYYPLPFIKFFFNVMPGSFKRVLRKKYSNF